MASRRKVRITGKARAQLADIYEYSLCQWGKVAAEKYIREIEYAINEAAAERKITRINPDFSNTNPYCIVKSHNIFFEFTETELIVLAVLHSKMNI